MMIDSVIVQITEVDIQSLVWSVIALVTALTAIGAVIEKFIQTHTQNQKVKTWTDIVSKDLNETKKSLHTTDQWVLENH
jgi:hypothetical protein